MAASRRARPGARKSAARLRRGDQLLALLRRQRLVLGPVIAQLAALLAGLGHALVVLARLAALLGGELRPGLHAPLHARLRLGLHGRVALGDAQPLAPPLGL